MMRSIPLLLYHWSVVILNVTFMGETTISLTSSPSSPIMAGDTVTLTCSVTLPTGVTATPVFQWVGPGVTPSPADPTTSGQIVSSDLTLSKIATSQAGQYTCTSVILNGPNTTSITVSVQSKSSNVCATYMYIPMRREEFIFKKRDDKLEYWYEDCTNNGLSQNPHHLFTFLYIPTLLHYNLKHIPSTSQFITIRTKDTSLKDI